MSAPTVHRSSSDFVTPASERTCCKPFALGSARPVGSLHGPAASWFATRPSPPAITTRKTKGRATTAGEARPFGMRLLAARRRIRLIPPKVLEPVGRHVGVSDRVLNVLVSEIVLQGPRVVAIVGELEPAGMAKHVRVDREWHFGRLAEALNEPVETDGTDWPAALGNEYVGVFGILTAELAQRAYLITADRVHAGNPVLDAVNMQAALG